MTSTFAFVFKQRRLEMRLNQTDFGRFLTMTRQRVQRLESGKCPKPDEFARIQARLGPIPAALPPPDNPSRQKVWRKVFRRRPTWRQPRKADTHVFLQAAREVFPEVMAAHESLIRQYRAALDEMVFESSYEAALAVQVLPARPDYLRVRPLAWGFDQHPIADPKTGRAINSTFPALGWVSGETRLLLITQVPLRTATKPYVPDFLIGIVQQGVQRWVIAEVDGPAHLAARDDVRTHRLKVPVVRFRWEDIAKGGRAEMERRLLEAAFPSLPQTMPRAS